MPSCLYLVIKIDVFGVIVLVSNISRKPHYYPASNLCRIFFYFSVGRSNSLIRNGMSLKPIT
jgi:hypothetical protein